MHTADMLGSMKVLAATLDDDLDERELNLLSVAFKNVVSGLRRARSIVKQIEDAERDECRAGLAKSYREKIERETREVSPVVQCVSCQRRVVRCVLCRRVFVRRNRVRLDFRLDFGRLGG